MNIYVIETGSLKLDGGAMFGIIPKVMWQKAYPTTEGNYTKWAMRCLLIDNEDKKILIDTGLGNKQPEKFTERFTYPDNCSLISSLKEKGYQPEDITDVIHTHLHFDHCGGSVKYDENNNLVPTFPNAVYWTGKEHWELSQNPNDLEKASFLKENLLPLQEHGVLKLVENESEILPGITVKIFNGHTKGQLIPYIKINDKHTLVYGGDLFPAACHIPMPWIMAYDTEPLITLEDKKRFFAEAIKNNYALFFEHDAYAECGILYDTKKGVRIKETMTLNDYLSKIVKNK